MLDRHKPLRAEKAARGWSLRSADNDTVCNRDGFTAWFTSKAKALAAAGSVKWDAREEWLVYDDA